MSKVLHYLRFVANEDVVVHRLWDVVDGELHVSSLRHVNEAHTSPGRPAIQRIRPGYQFDSLREEKPVQLHTDLCKKHQENEVTER